MPRRPFKRRDTGEGLPPAHRQLLQRMEEELKIQHFDEWLFRVRTD